MPYSILKIDGSRSGTPCYQVINSQTGKVHAKCTTKANAEAQVRVLESIPEKKMSWREFFVLHTKGKKILDMPAHMKKLSAEYKKK